MILTLTYQYFVMIFFKISVVCDEFYFEISRNVFDNKSELVYLE